jgi:inward rectifier potassium channel
MVTFEYVAAGVRARRDRPQMYTAGRRRATPSIPRAHPCIHLAMAQEKQRSKRPAGVSRSPFARRHAGTRRFRLGSREVFAKGLASVGLRDGYHSFMTIGWLHLFARIASFFLAFDALFGWLYDLVPGCIANLNPPGFRGAFFFSVETLATVGYGDMHPQTLYGHVVAMIEIFVGLMSLALITGIMFARFSRPRARFLFARHAVIRPVDGRRTLMFRAANERQNVIQEASAQLRMLEDHVTTEGMRIRRLTDLVLVRAHHPLFALGWNIMHVIDETSPLFAADHDSLEALRAAFVLTLSGTDETTGQVLMARAEYRADALRWNESFRDILEVAADGTLQIDYGKFHDVEPFRELRSS